MKEYRYKFSVIIPVYNVEDYLEETIDSVLVQSIGFEENIQLILVNDGSPDNSGEICEKYQRLYPNNVKYIVKENGGVSSARNVGIEHIEGKYVNFLDSDDKWGTNVFETVYNFFEKNYDEIDVVCGRIKFFEATNKWHALDYKFAKGDRIADLTNEEEYSTIQLSAATTFIKSEAITLEDRFNSDVKYGEDLLFITPIILRKATLGVLKSIVYYYRKRSNLSSALQNQRFDVDFYTVSPNRYYDGVINASKDRFGSVVPYIQNIIAYDIGWRVGALPPEEIVSDEKMYSEYCAMLSDKLQYVDESIILKNRVHKTITKKEALLRIKNKDDLYNSTSYIPEEQAIYYKDMPLIRLSENHGCCHVNVCEIVYNSNKKCNYLKIEGFVAKWLFNCCPDEEKKFIIRIGKKRYNVELLEYPFVNEGNFFETRKRYYYFQSELPFEKHMDDNGEVRIRIALSIGDNISNLSIKYGKFVPNNKFKPVYRIFGNYVMLHNRKRVTIYKPKNIKTEHLKLELKCIKWLMKNKLMKYAVIRMKVMLLKRRELKNKKLWLISDRYEKAGDNGEAFFRYMCSGAVEDKSILPIFVISKNSVDVERLQSIGRVMFFEDKEYPLYFLCADKIVSASGSDFATNPLNREARFYLTDLIKSKVAFLQHGIIKDDLSAWLNRFNKNLWKFVTSSPMEYDSIVNGNYMYSPKEVALTGLARYDELENRIKKQVVVIPTWRKSIKQSYDANTQSIYFEGFKETQFFNFYNNLINDERLLEVMRRKGYHGLFCLHPIHEKQSVDYQSNDVFDVNSGFVEYKKVFSESALLITDFSSVFFDFGYLRKPVVYTHFDKEEFFAGQSYDEGYFSYEDNGFGPVCYDYESTVQAIIDMIENDCVNPPEYLERIDKFYAFSDRNNCQRIFEAIT